MWTLNKMLGVGVMQEKNGALIQAARSAKLSAGSPTAIVGVEKLSAAHLYPNPANDVLHIDGADGATATVYNIFGQQMLISKIGKASVMSIIHLPAGSYLVRLTDGLNASSLSFTKE